MKNKFKATFINHGKFDVRPDPNNGSWWYLENEKNIWGVNLEWDDQECEIKPPHNMKFDYASIPRIMWRFIGPPTGFGKDGNYGPAAVIHDYLYMSGGRITAITREIVDKMLEDMYSAHDRISILKFTRKECDQIFLACMKELKVDKWRRNLMYAAVRIGGKKHFGRGFNK